MKDKQGERAKYVAEAENLTLPELQDIAKLLGLSLSSTQKNQIAEELVDFLEKPKFEAKKETHSEEVSPEITKSKWQGGKRRENG